MHESEALFRPMPLVASYRKSSCTDTLYAPSALMNYTHRVQLDNFRIHLYGIYV